MQVEHDVTNSYLKQTMACFPFRNREFLVECKNPSIMLVFLTSPRNSVEHADSREHKSVLKDTTKHSWIWWFLRGVCFLFFTSLVFVFRFKQTFITSAWNTAFYAKWLAVKLQKQLNLINTQICNIKAGIQPKSSSNSMPTTTPNKL